MKFWNLVPKLWHKFPSADFFKYEITPPYRAYSTYIYGEPVDRGWKKHVHRVSTHLPNVIYSIIFCIQHIVLYNTEYVVLQKEESI